MRACSLDICEKIKFHKDGLFKHQIAKQLDKNRCAVRRIIKQYEETGTLEEKPKSGRPRMEKALSWSNS